MDALTREARGSGTRRGRRCHDPAGRDRVRGMKRLRGARCQRVRGHADAAVDRPHMEWLVPGFGFLIGEQRRTCLRLDPLGDAGEGGYPR